MGTITIPNSFSSGTTIKSSEVNANFTTVANAINGNLDANNLASGAVTTAKIADSNVTTAKIADSNVTTGKIADDAVTDAKLVYGKVRSRQGGSATNWATAGTTTYDYSGTNTFIQVGSKACNASPTTITFPTAFNQTPVVFANVITAVGGSNGFVRIDSASATQFAAQVVADTGAGLTDQTINWLAIGQ